MQNEFAGSMVQVTKENVVWIGVVVVIAGGAGALIAGGVLGDLAGEGAAETVFIEGTATQGLPTQLVAEATVKNTGSQDIRVLVVTLDGLVGNEILYADPLDPNDNFTPTTFDGIARTYDDGSNVDHPLEGDVESLNTAGGITVAENSSSQFSGVLGGHSGVAAGAVYTITAVYTVDGTNLIYITDSLRIGI